MPSITLSLSVLDKQAVFLLLMVVIAVEIALRLASLPVVEGTVVGADCAFVNSISISNPSTIPSKDK